MKGYLRVASIMPSIKVGNVTHNLNSIKDEILKVNALSVKFCVLPELCLTGNGLESLYFDKNILNNCKNALFSLLTFSNEFDLIIIVSMPFEYKSDYSISAGILTIDSFSYDGIRFYKPVILYKQ